MDLPTLQFLTEDRFTLFAVPASISILLQLAGLPDPAENLGVPVGHTTRTLRQFLKATFGFFNASSKTGSVPFPSLVDWKPIFTFQFVHHDLSHFLGNYITLAQAIVVMKFPSWAGTRGWRRGGFVSALITSGSVAGALTMDAFFSDGNKKTSTAPSSNSSSSSSASSYFGSSNASTTTTGASPSGNQNSASPSSFISSYLPSQVTSAANWVSENVLPPSNWHNAASSSSSTSTSTSNFNGEGGAGAGGILSGWISGISSKISNFASGLGGEPKTVMLGISSAAFSVIGYNLSYNPRADSIVSAAMIVGHTVLGELSRRRQLQQQQEQQPSGTLFPTNEAIMTAHVAHIGGFVWGVFVGYVCRSIERRRQQRLMFRFNEANAANGALVEDDRGNRGRVLGRA